ncbi:MAG: hypothetical protein L3J87_03740, partial [Thermoplasmata archaeon]|nr:hypothetical protein [Thermoplasmata archaeon]
RRIAAAVRSSGSAADGGELPESVTAASETAVVELDELLADDFNTREAIARLFVWSRSVADWLPGLSKLSPGALATLEAPYRWAAEMLGLFGVSGEPDARDEALARLVAASIEARAAARGRGDYAEADRIRTELGRAGVQLEDHGTETGWHLVGPSDRP